MQMCYVSARRRPGTDARRASSAAAKPHQRAALAARGRCPVGIQPRKNGCPNDLINGFVSNVHL
jgi:hypothetical protein